jgi:O-succinylbenzoate synthase
MRIRLVEVIRLDLVLLHALRTSVGTHARRPVVIVRIETDAATGWGECSALLEPNYTEEYADGAERILQEFLVPSLLAAGTIERTLDGCLATMDCVRGNPMAKSALEMALLDAHLRESNRSLAEMLGSSRGAIDAGANVSLGSRDEVLQATELCVAAGYRRVKLKIAPGGDVANVEAIRATYPDLLLCVDANGSYDLARDDDLAALHALDRCGLTAIEQPLAPEDLLAHARLALLLKTPIMLDESVATLGTLDLVIALAAADGLCIKPARVGGIRIARAMHDRAVAAGLHCSIGGMLETGIGRSAAVTVGALPGFDLPGDLGGSARYFSPDLTPAHELIDGQLLVPTGAGIGVMPVEETLRSAQTRSSVFPAL